MTGLPQRVAAVLAELPRPVCAFVYAAQAARAQLAQLRAALPAGTTVLYAMKANGHPGLLTALARAADGIEVASGGELAAALAAGATRVAFSGPAKTTAELAAAAAAVGTGVDVTLHVESVRELGALAALGEPRPRVSLRVNRTAAPRVHGSHRMAGAATPFGLDEESLPEAMDVARAAGVEITGFHLHAVSNNLDATAHAAFIAQALDWSVDTAQRHGIRLERVNVGGGFGVDHTGATELDLAALTVPPPPDGVELIVEPGRYLATPAGWYAAEVIDVKRTHGRWFAVLRGGIHHFRLPAAWGYSHPFTVLPVDDWPYPYPRPGVHDAPVDAVGELCTPRDVLTRGQPVDRVRAGDILVFANAGGYGWEISHHEFLRHEHPRFVLLS